LSARAVLMSPDNGRINHRIFIVWIIRQGFEKILPNTAPDAVDGSCP